MALTLYRFFGYSIYAPIKGRYWCFMEQEDKFDRIFDDQPAGGEKTNEPEEIELILDDKAPPSAPTDTSNEKTPSAAEPPLPSTAGAVAADPQPVPLTGLRPLIPTRPCPPGGRTAGSTGVYHPARRREEKTRLRFFCTGRSAFCFAGSIRRRSFDCKIDLRAEHEHFYPDKGLARQPG